MRDNNSSGVVTSDMALLIESILFSGIPKDSEMFLTDAGSIISAKFASPKAALENASNKPLPLSSTPSMAITFSQSIKSLTISETIEIKVDSIISIAASSIWSVITERKLVILIDGRSNVISGGSKFDSKSFTPGISFSGDKNLSSSLPFATSTPHSSSFMTESTTFLTSLSTPSWTLSVKIAA